jgi:hypothetical protein
MSVKFVVEYFGGNSWGKTREFDKFGDAYHAAQSYNPTEKNPDSRWFILRVTTDIILDSAVIMAKAEPSDG